MRWLRLLFLLPLFLLCAEGARVERVIDGDTIVLEGGERVRYIGIDTPEQGRPFCEEATEANRGLVEGKRVRIEFDVQRRDRFGRLLAYIYVDTTFVNAALVREGYAQAATYPPNVRHAERFRSLQRQAREREAGLWRLRPRREPD